MFIVFFIELNWEALHLGQNSWVNFESTSGYSETNETNSVSSSSSFPPHLFPHSSLFFTSPTYSILYAVCGCGKPQLVDFFEKRNGRTGGPPWIHKCSNDDNSSLSRASHTCRETQLWSFLKKISLFLFAHEMRESGSFSWREIMRSKKYGPAVCFIFPKMGKYRGREVKKRTK